VSRAARALLLFGVSAAARCYCWRSDGVVISASIVGAACQADSARADAAAKITPRHGLALRVAARRRCFAVLIFLHAGAQGAARYSCCCCHAAARASASCFDMPGIADAGMRERFVLRRGSATARYSARQYAKAASALMLPLIAGLLLPRRARQPSSPRALCFTLIFAMMQYFSHAMMLRQTLVCADALRGASSADAARRLRRCAILITDSPDVAARFRATADIADGGVSADVSAARYLPAAGAQRAALAVCRAASRAAQARSSSVAFAAAASMPAGAISAAFLRKFFTEALLLLSRDAALHVSAARYSGSVLRSAQGVHFVR